MMEKWKPIPGFDGYQISDAGRVKNPEGALLKPWKVGGYLAVDLFLPATSGLGWRARRKGRKIHNLMLRAFVGEPLDGQIGCHKNDVKTDNWLGNLYWGTHKENAADSIRLGTFKFANPGLGENHGNAKYSDDLITKIRAEYTGKRGEQTHLGRKYNVSQQHVSSIVNGKLRQSAGGIR